VTASPVKWLQSLWKPRGGANGATADLSTERPYAGASRWRKQLANWLPFRAMADAELLPDQDMLVARSRDLARNNGVTSGAFQTLVDNVVGIGLRLACYPDYRALGRDIAWAEDWSQQVESLWRTWADTTACDAAGRFNFHYLTSLVYRSCIESGEALALPLWLERGDTPFRTCLQLIEVDRLSNPNFTPPTLKLRGGIEMDDYGKPLTYYVRVMQDWMVITGWVNVVGPWQAIPAETEWGRKRVIHVLATDRVDQTRGKPVLSSVIEQFRMLDSYQRTELQSAIVNSLVAGVIETPLDPQAIHELMGGDPNAYLQNKNQWRVQLEGGAIIPLYPGDKLTPFTPTRPAPQYNNFVEAVQRQIGVALGMPYELAIKDFSKTNYSSARAALNEAWRYFMSRRMFLASYWLQPVYCLWLEEAVNAGLIDAPGYYDLRPLYERAKWIGPGRGYVDPMKEAEASQLRMASMTSTLEKECAEQGDDWMEVLEQAAIERERLKQLGLYVEPPPPAPVGSPAEPTVTPVRQKE
jgi:lambda family phage portal protein